MSIPNNKKLSTQLKSIISPERYQHSIRTAKMAQQLAIIFKINPKQAYLAGLLHDCARDLSPLQLLAEAKKYKVKISKIFKANPILLHGLIGSFWLKDKFKIKDNQIAKAIKNHIVGNNKMSLLEKIIFLADYIEEHRKFPAAVKIRHTIFKNKNLVKKNLLDQMVIYKAKTSLYYARKKNWQIHPALLKLTRIKV